LGRAQLEQLICRNAVSSIPDNIRGVRGELRVSSVPERVRGNCDPVAAAENVNVLMRTRRLSRAVTELYDAKLRPFGISAVQFSLLEIIGRMQPTTRAAIARKEELDKSTLTRDLKSIFLEGWVEEVREQANGRSRPIALTKAGQRLLLNAEPAWLAAQNEVKLLLRRQGFIVA
jgi:DNA-binding MarR family transcriptional regulator